MKKIGFSNLFIFFFSLFLSVFVFSSQAQAANKFLIFVPGYYGTTFYKKTGEKVWLTGEQTIIGNSGITLALPIPGVQVPEALDLKLGEVLDEVNIFGYEYMAYGKTQTYLKEIAERKGYRYVAVTYDWRKDPMNGVLALDKTIQGLRTSPEDEFYIVAHSLGATIVAYYARYGAVDYENAVENWAGLKNLNKVVLVAAPFKGTMTAFNTMFRGINRGLNNDLLSARSVSTLESSYFMLPPFGYAHVYGNQLEILDLNLHDPKIWLENGWGLFFKKNGFEKEPVEARFDYVSRMLHRGSLFSQLLNSPGQAPAKKIPFLYIKGYGLETSDKPVWADPKGRPDFFIFGRSLLKRYFPQVNKNIFVVDGDGTLPDYSTEPVPMLESLGAQVIRNRAEHLEALQADLTKSQIQQFFE